MTKANYSTKTKTRKLVQPSTQVSYEELAEDLYYIFSKYSGRSIARLFSIGRMSLSNRAKKKEIK